MKTIPEIIDLAQSYAHAEKHNTDSKERRFCEMRDALYELQSRLESLEHEMQEQCRIIGMSVERELSLIAKIESLEKDALQWRLRLETIRALYPSAPSDIELDTAIDAAMKSSNTAN